MSTIVDKMDEIRKETLSQNKFLMTKINLPKEFFLTIKDIKYDTEEYISVPKEWIDYYLEIIRNSRSSISNFRGYGMENVTQAVINLFRNQKEVNNIYYYLSDNEYRFFVFISTNKYDTDLMDRFFEYEIEIEDKFSDYFFDFKYIPNSINPSEFLDETKYIRLF